MAGISPAFRIARRGFVLGGYAAERGRDFSRPYRRNGVPMRRPEAGVRDPYPPMVDPHLCNGTALG